MCLVLTLFSFNIGFRSENWHKRFGSCPSPGLLPVSMGIPAQVVWNITSFILFVLNTCALFRTSLCEYLMYAGGIMFIYLPAKHNKKNLIFVLAVLSVLTFILGILQFFCFVFYTCFISLHLDFRLIP